MARTRGSPAAPAAAHPGPTRRARWPWSRRPSGWRARWSRPRTASPAPRTCELAALLLLLALGGCSAALWSCPPGGGVLGGGGCKVFLLRGLTEVDLLVVTEGKMLQLG